MFRFVLFGMFITLDSIFNLNVALVSVGILVVLYGVRLLMLKLIVKKDNAIGKMSLMVLLNLLSLRGIIFRGGN